LLQPNGHVDQSLQESYNFRQKEMDQQGAEVITPLRASKKPLTPAEKTRLLREKRMNAVRNRSMEETGKIVGMDLTPTPKRPNVDSFNTPTQLNASPNILSPVTPATPIDNTEPTQDLERKIHKRNGTPDENVVFQKPTITEDEFPDITESRPNQTSEKEKTEKEEQFYQTIRKEEEEQPEEEKKPDVTPTKASTKNSSARIIVTLMIATYSAILSVLCGTECKTTVDGLSWRNITRDISTWPYVPPLMLFLTTQFVLTIPIFIQLFSSLFVSSKKTETEPGSESIAVQKWFDRVIILIRLYGMAKSMIQNICLYLFTFIFVNALIRVFIQHNLMNASKLLS
jgi:hypothetical protein